MRELPGQVAELAERFDLEVGPPFEPGGYASWTAPARRSDGTDAVLKICWRHPEAEHEPDGLQLWNGQGTVQLFESLRTERTIVLLLERCVPGTVLSTVVSEEASDEIVAGLLKRLWIEPPAGHPFRPLSDMTAMWAGELAERDARISHEVDPGLVTEALRIFHELPSSATSHVLLTTDLHATNILAARREPWLVIDPKPYVGDPAYDPCQHILNCLDRANADPFGLIERLASLTGVDAERLRLWLFARCVQEAVHEEPFRWGTGPIAEAIAP